MKKIVFLLSLTRGIWLGRQIVVNKKKNIAEKRDGIWLCRKIEEERLEEENNRQKKSCKGKIIRLDENKVSDFNE